MYETRLATGLCQDMYAGLGQEVTLRWMAVPDNTKEQHFCD